MTSDDVRFVKIAVGVAAGIAIAGLIGFGTRIWLMNAALNSIQETATRSTSDIQAAMAATVRRQQAEAAAQAEIARTKRNDDLIRLAAEQRAAEVVTQSRLTADTARDTAWAKFYRKPPRCDPPADNPVMVHCANEYIRAKRRFQETYHP
jgi:hypothetical protein